MSGYEKLLQKRHENSIWTRYVLIATGLWLLANLLTFTYDNERIFLGDLVSGFGLIVFGALSMKEERRWAPWLSAFVGVWLLLSPIVFWAADPFCYLNDTLVGILAISLSIIIPGTPGIIESGPEVPIDWSYNPSSWLQRLPLIALSFFSFLIARYLTAFQLRYIPTIWEPFFDEGAVKILSPGDTSLFSVPEAGIASFIFILQALLASKGSSKRWHTMPWAVIFFGLTIILFGLIGSISILLQPLIFGVWSGWMLLLALFMMGTVILAVDEIAATVQFIARSVKNGTSFWSTFWVGSRAVGGHADVRSPNHTESYYHLFPAMCWGLTFPSTLLLSGLLGIWLLLSSQWVEAVPSVMTANHILGALITIFSILSCAEVLRSIRYLNVFFGAMVCMVPWYYTHVLNAEGWGNLISGLAVIFLSFSKGQIKQRYGSIERFMR